MSEYPHADRWKSAMRSGKPQAIRDFLAWVAGQEDSPYTEPMTLAADRPMWLGKEITEEDAEAAFASGLKEEADFFDKCITAIQRGAVSGLLQRWHGPPVEKEKLVQRFFGVDPDELERERRRMIDACARGGS